MVHTFPLSVDLGAFLVSRHSFADKVIFFLGHCELPALRGHSLVQASRLFVAGLAFALGFGLGNRFGGS